MLLSSILVHDIMMAAFSMLVSLYLRIGDDFFDYTPLFLLKNVAVFTLIAASVFSWLQTYRNLWRFTSIDETIPVFVAVLLITVIYLPFMALMGQQEYFSYSVPFINVLVLLTLLLIPRFFYRYLHEQNLINTKKAMRRPLVPVLLVGHDDVTELFIREASYSPYAPYEPVGIITPVAYESGRRIHHVPILGHIGELDEVLQELEDQKTFVKKMIITDGDISAHQVRDLANFCARSGIILMHMLQHFSVDEVRFSNT